MTEPVHSLLALWKLVWKKKKSLCMLITFTTPKGDESTVGEDTIDSDAYIESIFDTKS